MEQGRFDGLHEAFDREEAAEMSSDRSFGFVVGSVLALIGAIGFVRESHHWIWWSSAAALLLAAALLAPGRLGPLNRLWTRFGLLLAAVVSPIVLAMLFYLCVTPVGILMRLVGKDPMQLEFHPEADSYWIRRDPAGPEPDTLKNQY